jgi:anti-sigma factor RsiW
MTQARNSDREPISEMDLHGYIDGELPALRRAEVEAYLADHPDEAARLAEYHALTLSLHRLYDGDRAASPRIDMLTADLDRTLRRRRTVHRLVRMAAVAAVLAIVAGVASSVHDRFRQAEDRFLAFTQQATDAHLLFAGAKPPAVDVKPDGNSTVVSWLSQRLTGVPVRAPDLHKLGYTLTVERILPSPNGPAAQLMYEGKKAAEPVTLFIGKSKGKQQTAFTYVQNDDLSIFYWQEGPFAYSLAGKLGRADLLSLAEAVNAQLVALPPMPKTMVQRRAADVIRAAGKEPLTPDSDTAAISAAPAVRDAVAHPADVLVRPVAKKIDATKIEASESSVAPEHVKTDTLQPAPVKDGAAVKKAPKPSAPANESDTAKKT